MNLLHRFCATVVPGEYVPDMLENGVPVRREYPEDEPVPYRVTPLGREWWEKFQAENREADEKILAALDRLIAAKRGGVAAPIYDTLPDGGPPCKTHPDAPHGFLRNASHSEDRYVCECEFWEPEEACKDDGFGWDANGSFVEGPR